MKIEGTEKVKAWLITSRYGDYEGNVEEWRQAFFRLLSIQNTYSWFYKLTISSTRDHEPYLYAIVKDGWKDDFVDELENLGYRNVKLDDVIIEVFTAYDDDVFDYFSD